MASFTLTRLCKGVALGRTFGQHVLSRTAPVSAPMIQHKTFMLSPVSRKRIYGPQEVCDREDEVNHWKNERVVAVALLPLIPTALAFPNVVLDMTLCSVMVLHSHWRLSGVCQDYIHGEMLPNIAKYGVLFLSIAAFGSLCYFNYADVGFAKAVRLIYSEL
ncbi:hypothetical protein LSH36_252g03016 [Paralvinella palmiformis]|uniref:Succinate dehydrogenase [ubiquinone] cytochrome b small subunit n=1 Tax=Paralvinella palmiformis TaxID=53620 RepID=A0AAD9N350_9ANNE|nr:hypothetical protein LSH36_252g03016 [Paralvinella palmiformis]